MPATAAQIHANRENAKSSTGPRTPEGKSASARNSTKFGLFSTQNCVQPEEQHEYDELCAGLWDSLHPVGAVEDLLATEVIRCAWRLRRCAVAETALGRWNRIREAENHERSTEDFRPADPVLYDYTAPVQASIDRARSQAQSAMRRAMADLANLQTERLLRIEVLPEDVDPATFGLAHIKQLLTGLGADSQRQLLAAKVNGVEKVDRILKQHRQGEAEIAQYFRQFREPVPPTQPESPALQNEAVQTVPAQNEAAPPPDPHCSQASQTPRNAPCPCGSGQKHKRCCGRTAPAVLTMAA